MFIVSFGSKQRGDFNHSSDTDLLIIDTDTTRLIECKKEYANIGYSVTAMPLIKASYLVKKGSLFFKHIINEGSLIGGNLYNYNSLMKGWKKAKTYQNEIEGNLDLLELLYYLPKTHEGILFAVDLLIISIRNILIRKFAELDLFVFSWDDLSNCAVKYGYFNTAEKVVVMTARQVKNYYRYGYDIKVSLYLVEKLMQILRKITGKKIGINFSSKKEIVNLHSKFHDGSYKQLRAIELLCAYYNFKSVPLNYLQWIRDPNYFALTKGEKVEMINLTY